MIDSRSRLPLDPAMADSPRTTPAKRAEHAERTERLARALRENLLRRKAQARAKELPATGRGGDEPPA